MNDLLFIRHAETDMAGTFCGHSDPPVNSAGHRQIQQLIERLRDEPIAAIYTSDLQRAQTTARSLAEFFAVSCIARPSLREIDFGEWEGLTWEQIERRDSGFATRWLDSFPELPAPHGEAIESFQARVKAETRHLLHHCEYSLSSSEDRLIAVVTHAGVIREILRSDCHVNENEAWLQTKHYCCTARYGAAIPSLQQEQR